MFRAGHRPATVFLNRPARRKARLSVESLESRTLLSTATAVDPVMTPSITTITADRRGGGGISGGITNPTPYSSALTPSQIASAYSINQSATSGSGQTIAIVAAYNDPNIQADLAAFDAQYGLPAANLTVVNQNGQTTGLPPTDPNWSLEIAMDVEWAHSAAPGAKLVLVEANSASVSDLMTAVGTAAKMANVVTMSWGGSEFQGETAYDSVFANPKVTFVAASGDSGGAYGAEWPAVSPYVVSVGGTTLSLTSAESAWNGTSSRFSGTSGSGGGTSLYEPVPAYQKSVLGASATKRSTPDVAAVGNPSTGVSVYNTVPGTGQTGWFQVGGTSAGAPIWAGIIAAADQAHGSPLSSTQTLNLLYSQAAKPSTYAATFHDITVGSNYAGSASKGYDVVTGLGTPIASGIVASAAASTSLVKPASAPATVITTTPTTTTTTTTRTTPNAQEFVVTVAAAPVVATPAPIFVAVAPAATSVTAPAITPAAPVTSSAVTAVATLPALPVQPLTESFPSSRLSRDDGGRVAAKSNWRREPGLYIEPGVQPLLPSQEEALLAFELESLTSPWWAGPDVVDVAREVMGTEPSPSAAEADSEPMPVPLDLPEVSPTIAAGAAVAAWGLWEYRSRRSDRDRRRPIKWEAPTAF
jgi:hypothetical protein